MRTRNRAAALFLTLALSAGWAGAATSDKASTASGEIAKLDATQRTLYVKIGSAQERFVWTADTKINGTLAPGNLVTVKYTVLPDGQNVAHQITVSKT